MGITEKGIWVGELSPDVLYSKYLSCLETGNKTKAEEYLAGMTELLKTYQNKMINSSVYTSSLEYYSTLKVEKANNEYLSALVSLANGNKTDAEVHYKSAKGINPFMIRIFIKE